ncbi:hypothetical protein [Enterococcus mundtii]
MPEIYNLPNFYHDSEILNNVDLPEEDNLPQSKNFETNTKSFLL